MRRIIGRGLVAACFWGLVGGVAGMTLKEAGEGLGSDEAALRNEAEKTLREAGIEALAVVEPLGFSDHAVVAARARRVRAWILLGMDESVAPELRDRIFGIRRLSMAERKELIDDLFQHPRVLIHLHSLLLQMSLNDEAFGILEEQLVGRLHAAVQVKRFDAASIEVKLLDPSSVALAVEALGVAPDESFHAVYRRWVEACPELIGHLELRGAMMEIARMKDAGQQEQVFEFLGSVENQVGMGELLKLVLESDLEAGYRCDLVLALLRFPEIGGLMTRSLHFETFLEESEAMWREGREALCLRLFEVSFWIMQMDDETHLGEFPAMAKLHGVLDEVLGRMEGIVYHVPGFPLKMAYLLNAAGRSREALTFSREVPDSALHRLLVIEAGDEAAAELRGNEEWKAWVLYHAGDVAAARGLLDGIGEKGTVLKLLLGDHGPLVDEGIESGGAGASGAAFARMLAQDRLLFEKTLARVNAKLDEGGEVSKRWLEYLFDDSGRVPDREEVLRLAERLSGATGDDQWLRRLRAQQGRQAAGGKAPEPIGRRMVDVEVRRPEPGGFADPMAARCQSVDVVERCLNLWEDGKREEARQVMRDFTVRLIYDRKLRTETVSVVYRRGRMNRNQSGTELEIAVVMMCRSRVPAQLARPALESMALLPVARKSFYLRDGWYLWLTKALARHGSHRQALAAIRTYWGGNLAEDYHYKHIEEAALMAEMELRVALDDKDHAAALAAAERGLVASPFRPMPLAVALARFRKAGDSEAAESLDAMVSGYWEAKMEGLPECRDYQQALGAWKATIAAGE